MRHARGFRKYFDEHKSSIVIFLVLGIFLFGAFVRLYNLEDIPPGLHGDEAHVGLQANKILAGELSFWNVVDTYGQPSPALPYFIAFLFSFLGSSLFVLKLASAIIGILTVIVTYFAVREMFDLKTAIFATIFSAFAYWHIHFSRMAFQLIFVPLVISLALYLLYKAINSKKTAFFVLAGMVAGGGLYTYPAYPAFLGPFVLFIFYLMFRKRGIRKELVFLFVALLVVAGPYMHNSLAGEANHFQVVSIFNDDRYTQLETTADKAMFMVKRALMSPTILFKSWGVDHSDGMGMRPLVDPFLGILIVVGVIICIIKIRDERFAFILVALLAAFAGVILGTDPWGVYRREITGLIPMMIIAGISTAYLHNKLQKIGFLRNALIFLVMVAFVSYNVNYYFNEFSDSGEAKFVFVYDLVQGAKYIQTLPADTVVYFYATRWAFDYETLRFLLPSVKGESRGRKYGEFTLEKRHDSVAYIFFPEYLNLAENVSEIYPGGQKYEFKDDGNVLFRSYIV